MYSDGKITDAVMDEYWWWSHKFFYENKVLTNDYDPWMMGDSNLNNVEDWDIYPMPSLPGQDNGVSIVLDATVIYNYALDDGDPALSDAEHEKLRIAYEFTKFYLMDTRAKQSMLDTKFLSTDTGQLVSGINDSLPIVTGEEFNKQMQIWFESPTHQALKDPAKKPGFHKVLEIWESGKVYGSMGIPMSLTVEGETQWVLDAWWNLGNADLVGAKTTDPNWLDNIYAKLPDMQAKMSVDFEKADQELMENIKKFYGKTDADLNK